MVGTSAAGTWNFFQRKICKIFCRYVCIIVDVPESVDGDVVEPGDPGLQVGPQLPTELQRLHKEY